MALKRTVKRGMGQRISHLGLAALFLLSMAASNLSLLMRLTSGPGNLSYQGTRAFSSGENAVNNTAVDANGNTYMVGYFVNTADFNPDGGGDKRHSVLGIGSSYLTKTNANGSYGWTRTFSSSKATNVTTDTSGNVYTAGTFSGTVDFNSTGGGDSKNAGLGTAAYLTRINADGSYGWTRVTATMPLGINTFNLKQLVVDASGTARLVGQFSGTVDFNPAGGGDPRTATDSLYVSRINADGSYGWTRVVGATGDTAAKTDPSGNVYISGGFSGTIDFNPEGGGDAKTVSTNSAYLTRINADGSYGWTYVAQTGTGTPHLAVNSTGAYMTDGYDGLVNFDPAGDNWRTFGSQGNTDHQQLNNPGNVALDAARNKVYVVENYSGFVFRMDSGTGGTTLGANLEMFDASGVGMGTVYDVAIDTAANRLFIDDGDHSRLVLIDTGSGGTTFGGNLQTFGTNGSGAGQFSWVRAIALDQTHNRLFASDDGNSRMIAMDSGGGGTTLGANWTSVGDAGGYDLAADPIHNKLFLSQWSTSVFNGPAIVTMDSGTGGTTLGANVNRTDSIDFGKNFSDPLGVAIDPANNKLYVTDIHSNTATVRMDSGTGGTTLGANWVEINHRGDDLAFDSTHNKLFIASALDHTIASVDSGTGGTTWGNNYQTFAGNDSATGQFNAPNDVIFDAANNKLFVADTFNRRVVRMDSGTGGTTFGANFQSFGNWGTTQQVDEPAGIALDSVHNRIYVADDGYPNSTLKSFDSGGGGTTFGANFQTASGISNPSHVAVDPVHNVIFVSDITNVNHIVRMDSGTGGTTFGANAQTFGSGGGGVNQFEGPEGLTVDTTHNRLYVADADNNRLVVIDSGTGGTTFGANWQEFHISANSPSDVKLDTATNKLYISSYFDKIIRMDSGTGGTTLGNNLETFGAAGSGLGQFNGPQGISLDTTNHKLYVTDGGNNRIIHTTFVPDGTTGTYVTKIGLNGSYGWTRIATDTGTVIDDMAIDISGNVYVSGIFNGPYNFNPDGVADPHNAGSIDDVYLSRTNADGSYGWTKTIASDDSGGLIDPIANTSVAVTGSTVYVAGHYYGAADFNPSGGGDAHDAGLNYEAFFTRFGTNGNYQWTKVTAAASNGVVADPVVLATSGAGDLYANFPIVPGKGLDFNPSGGGDIKTTPGRAVTRINANSSYGWARVTLEDATGGLQVSDFTTGSDGSVYRIGTFQGLMDFNPDGSGDKINQLDPYVDTAFITKTNPDGSYAWTKAIEGVTPVGVTVGTDGSVYVGGYFQNTVDFDPSAGIDQRTSAGGKDEFLTKLGADGSYGWTYTTAGPNNDETALAVKAAPGGGVYLLGQFFSTVDFNSTGGGDVRTATGQAIHLTKLNANGSYGWTKIIADGNLQADTGAATIAVAQDDSVYTTGAFYGVTDFNPEGGGDVRTPPTNYGSAYVTKTNANGSYGWTKTYDGTDPVNDYAYGVGVAVGPNNDVYATGVYAGTVDFDPDAAGGEETTQGTGKYIVKLASSGSHLWTNSAAAQDGSSSVMPSWLAEYWRYGPYLPVHPPSSVLVVDANDNLYTPIEYFGNIDLNPTGGGDVRTADLTYGSTGVTKLNADGTYGWTRTIDNNGGGFAWISGAALDQVGNIYASGYYVGNVDFNPSAGGDQRSVCPNVNYAGSCGEAFVTSWAPDGTYGQTKATQPPATFGPNDDAGISMISDLRIVTGQMVFTDGLFSQFVDFNPDSGEDAAFADNNFSNFHAYLSWFALSGSIGGGGNTGGGNTGGGNTGGGSGTGAGTTGGSGSTRKPPKSSGTGQLTSQTSAVNDFDFSVNLSNGTTVGPGTYGVTVSPASGSNLQFDMVEFYVGSTLVHTAHSDGTGQFTWAWDTAAIPGGTIRVVVHETGGGTSSKQFFVNVRLSHGQGSTVPGSGPKDRGTGFWYRLDQFLNHIPPAGVVSFPYWLFVLLAALALTLFLQGLREAAEVNSIEKQLGRDKLLNAQKTVLVQLVSHYLRTPMTLLTGAADLADALHAGQEEIWKAVATQAKGLSAKVEEVVGLTTHLPANQESQATARPSVRLWKRPSFLVPVILIGLLAFGTDVLAGAVSKISLSTLNLIGQLVTFAIVVVLFYASGRGRMLVQAKRQRLLRARRQEAVIDDARNDVIKQSLGLLTPYLSAIQERSRSLGASKAAELLTQGRQGLETMLQRFKLASQFGAGTPVPQPVEFSLKGVLDKAIAGSQAKADAKRITIQRPHERTMKAGSPDWLAYALAAVIDNAVAYSPEGGTVTITADDSSIHVKDDGAGIPAEALDLLLKPFARVDDVLTFNHEGIGLSLYLDKLIMTYLGGKIAIRSRSGHGTDVLISL